MPVAAVVRARDVREHAQLLAAQQAVGDGHAQHGGVALHIQAVAQPQLAKLVLGELALQEAAGLVAELVHALLHESVIDGVVAVHGASDQRTPRGPA